MSNPDFSESENRTSTSGEIKFMIVLLLSLAAFVGFLFHADTPVTRTYTNCTIKGINQEPYRGVVLASIYSTGCDPSDSEYTVLDVRMAEFGDGTASVENSYLTMKNVFKIGKTYNFETKGAKFHVFFNNERIVRVTEAEPAK